MAERIKTNCPRDCYDGCGIVIEVREQGHHRVLGDPDHPISRGKLCAKCAIAYNRSWQDPQLRLTTPLKRVGERGSNDFAPIGWDEALALVAQRMNTVIAEHGAASILHTHYSGTLSLIGFLFPNRLFAHIGASEVDPDTICNAAGHVAWRLQFGNSIVGFDPRTAKDARCILVWGANPAHSAPHTHEHWLAESPAKVIVVDPILTETARAADLHLRLVSVLMRPWPSVCCNACAPMAPSTRPSSRNARSGMPKSRPTSNARHRSGESARRACLPLRSGLPPPSMATVLPCSGAARHFSGRRPAATSCAPRACCRR
jgi:hypothetical protein